ncbi:MAG: hypothetical protein SVR94_19580, partial [Pseudomonadota bacterium]|nr:hypothetical protein [Pseudomonadota bacterium]
MKLFIPVLFSLLWLTPASTLAFSCSLDNVSSAECQALIDFYDQTYDDGNPWLHDDWFTGEVDDWYGVQTDGEHVTVLNLAENNLVGQLPASLCELTQLEILNLHQNQISGPIPTCFNQLATLKHLVLAGNQFTGTIPESLCSLTQLESLRLMSNQLSGNIPTCLGDLTQLDTLWLHGNQLTGTIPVELCQLNQLESLDLAYNEFSGALPSCIGNELLNLQVLYLSHNQFDGQIPASFSNLTALKQFYLNHNKFSGPLPAEFVSMALSSENLIQLHMSRNYFKLDDCQSVRQLIIRGGWEESVLGWPDGGFIHSPQINTVNNFDDENYCPPLSPTLIVKKAGSGSGVVVGTNIDCGNTCTSSYLPNEEVILTATSNP